MPLPITDQCIVLPFRAQNPQPFNGTGLALHFLVGNVLAVHTGLKEMWFGWRVKKIFPEQATFQLYCRDIACQPDLVQVSQSQQVRFWIYGSYADKTIRLHLFDAEQPDAPITPVDLAIVMDDNLVGLRTQLLEWLESTGRPMPQDQAQAALWPEAINPEVLGCRGSGSGRLLSILRLWRRGTPGCLAV